MKKIFILFLCLILVSCSKKGNKEIKIQDITTSKEVERKIKAAQSLNDLLEVKKIIKLETNKESLLGIIEDVIYRPEENLIIISDPEGAKGVFMFDADGNFIRRVGRYGNGPGEYQVIKSIGYCNKQIIIYSNPFKLIIYSLDGILIREIDFTREKWLFAADKMLVYKNDLYIYSNNSDYCVGPDNKKHRVFHIKNIEKFEKGYGETEETYGFSSGDIVLFNERVVYSSVFDGNIYQIFPAIEDDNIFISLGYLCDLSELKKSSDKIQYIVQNIKKLDSIMQLGEIKNFLFIVRHNKIEVANNLGVIINDNMKRKLILPKDYSEYASRLGNIYFHDGIIVPTTIKCIEDNKVVPNPALIIYGIKGE